MSYRLLIVTLLLLLGGFSALLLLQIRLQRELGAATSPQEVVVQVGQRKLVAGARAELELAGRRDGKADLIVRCAAGERWVTLEAGETSDEICAIRVRLTGFSSETGTLATSRAHLEVTWGDESASPETPS